MSNRSEARRVTLATIAEEVGVSRSTVSNAYNRPDQLSPELRARVLEAAQRLGYGGPHPAARGLRRGVAGAIGVVLTEALSYAFSDAAATAFLEGLSRASEEAGTGLLLLPLGPGREGDVDLVREAIIDGFVVYSISEDAGLLEAIRSRGLPCVFVDQPRPGDAPFVSIDVRAASREIAQHLVDLGHTRFATIAFRLIADGHTGPVDQNRQDATTHSVTRDRLLGYREALEAAGLDWKRVPIHEQTLSRQGGHAAARAVLAAEPRPTAILAMCDEMALGALDAARELGLTVPGDVSVVGFDDIPQAALEEPGLTTVQQPLVEKGVAAGRLLFGLDSRTDEDGQPIRRMFAHRLVVRQSTGPPPS